MVRCTAVRLIFMGTPDFAVPTARAAWRGRRHRGGRTRAAQARPTRPRLADTRSRAKREQRGIPVLPPKTLDDRRAQAASPAYKADAAVVVATA